MASSLVSDFDVATKLVIVVDRVRHFSDQGANRWDGHSINVSSFQVEGMSNEDFITRLQSLIADDVQSIRQNPVPLEASFTVGAAEYFVHAEGKQYPFLRISLLRSKGHFENAVAVSQLVAHSVRNSDMEAEYADMPFKMAGFIRFPVLESAV